MRDTVSIPRVALMHPEVRDEMVVLTDKAEALLGPRIAIRWSMTLRSIPEQDGLFALGRTVRNPDGYDKVKKPMGNIVTRARGGQSFHNFGLAGDFCLLYDVDGNGTWEKISWDELKDGDNDKVADWKEVVAVFTAAGWEWGGNWSSIHDGPHVEKRFGYPENCKALLAKYRAKDFIPGTNYVRL
jgi:peptidoglycan L-alanyl-D-glutamate endopeptidase CwlK